MNDIEDCHSLKTIEENNLGYELIDDEASFYNEISNNIMKSWGMKSWQFVEKLNYDIKELNNKFLPKITAITQYNNLDKNNNEIKIDSIFQKNDNYIKVKKIKEEEEIIDDTSLNQKYVYKLDMVKCRKNITYYSKYEWPVYSVMDFPKPFSSILQCGLFYVETKNIFPMRGAGWYSEPIVEYCLNKKMIELSDITLEFIPYKKLQYTHFQHIIDTLLEKFDCEKIIQKTSVNAYIGLMGKQKITDCRMKFTLSNNEAGNWLGERYKDEDIFIKNINLDNDNILYQGTFSRQVETESNKYPIYKMILEMEAIELHRLESIIRKHNGVPLDRNTDAILYHSKKEIIPEIFWDEEKKIMKYAPESAKELMIESMPNLKRKHVLDYDLFDNDWKIQYDYKGNVQNEAERIVLSNQSYHIDGRAGTGKTYLVNQIVNQLKEKKIKYICLSPTNKGARLIHGATIHSLYYKFKKSKKLLYKLLEDIQYIIIDEVSMMSHDFYQLFILIQRSFESLKFIICGDFDQLPPVQDSWTGDYKNCHALLQLCSKNRIQLTQCKRSDDILFNICKNVQIINKHDYPVKKFTYKNIAYTHNTRMHINEKCMKQYQIDNKLPFIEIKKDL